MKGLSAIQVEQLRQIGDYLRQVRETQSVSLEKVAKDTFIPLRLLNALETGEVERLPEPVYIKGFIRRYADVLELDGAEIADAFETQESVANPAPAVSQPAIAVAETPRSERQTSNTKASFPGLPYILAGVAAVGVLGAIAWGLKQAFQPSAPTVASASSTASSLSASPSSTQATAPPSAPTTSGSPSPSAATSSTATNPSTTPTSSSPNAPVQVNVSLVDRSWMEVVADGKVKFEGILAKGEQRTWTAQNTLMIRAGNAGAVVASLNQGQAKPLGKLGDVVDANFSRNANASAATTPQ
jgi:cytoskeletal protein RodZ